MVVNTDPSTQQHAVVIVCIVSPIVSSLFVAIRVWTRTSISHSVSWDDYTALITWLFCVIYSVLVGLATNYGFGWHTADMSSHRYIAYYQWVFMSSLVYLVTLWLYKFTILLLYLRLFGVDNKFKYCTWAVMLFVFGYLFTNFLTMIFGCTPIDKYWNAETPGHCIAQTKADFAYGSMNFISDLFIFVLPLPMVWHLQLSRREKLGVTLVFLSGAIAFVVAGVRYGLLVHKFYSTDRTWYAGKVYIWMVLEVNTGLICSCTPALKHFFKYFTSDGLSKSTSRGLLSPTKNNMPLGGRSDPGLLVRRNTGGRGFTVLGCEEMEMDVTHARGMEDVEVKQDV